MSTQTALIIPDLQIPLNDQAFVDKLINVASYVKPDKLLFIGDLTDSTEVGRWVKGRAGEYTGDLQAAFDETAKTVGRFRKAVGDDCQMTLIRSNHDDRTGEYVASGAPALAGLRSLDMRKLIGLDSHGVAYERGPLEFVPGAVAVHGHERAYSSVPGKYGVDRVKDYGKSVVYGHTHTPLLVPVPQGVGDERVMRWTMNVGHGMDMAKAGYLKDGFATWCQAFGIVEHDGVNSYPQLIMSMDGSFYLDGELWS